jgi:hypothetical protein
VNTPEDWINEGLAEYSAFLVSEDLVAREFAGQLLSEYKKRAVESKTESAIAETEGNSPDREVNRYDKPTMIMYEARKKFGVEKMTRFLKALYNRFEQSNKATTVIFLEEVEKNMGTDARAFFLKALYAKRWDKILSDGIMKRGMVNGTRPHEI